MKIRVIVNCYVSTMVEREVPDDWKCTQDELDNIAFSDDVKSNLYDNFDDCLTNREVVLVENDNEVIYEG